MVCGVERDGEMVNQLFSVSSLFNLFSMSNYKFQSDVSFSRSKVLEHKVRGYD